MENNFYVYIYLDQRKSGKYKYGEYKFEYEPFYVGKGKGRRWKDNNRNKYSKRIINKIKKIGLEPIILKFVENLNESNSFILESKLIESIGRKDLGKGPLINFTDGGEGSSGRIYNEDILKQKRKNFSDIQKEFEDRGYQLLTKENEYKSAHQKLEYICPKGHSGFIKWNKFQQKRNCPDCYNELRSKKQRKNFQEIINEFRIRGYQLLSREEQYINAHQRMEYICPNGHKNLISWSSFQAGHGCPYCKRLRINFSKIKKEFEKRNYNLLSKEEEYKNCYTKLNYICYNGHENLISWTHFQQGRNCPDCNKRGN